MVGGVNGAAGYQYFLQLRQSQGAGTPANLFFKTLNTNGNGSTGKDEFSVFQSALTGSPQGTQSSAQSDSTEFLVSLLQGAGQMGQANASTGATGSSASQQDVADQIFSQVGANGDGGISEAQIEQALSEMYGYQSGTGASAQADPLSSTDQLFGQTDTNGDGLISKDGLAALQSSLTGQPQSGAATDTSTSTSTEASDMSDMTSIVQQAISKYLQLSPAGMVGSAALGGLLATG